MYLKSIEVQGFKSFAQKINFEFHNGITGIVGPNGSGKSNVADAVRWVLGEQSAKQLRGGNMQDVIFAGTENRKPLSYASVAITLDNGDHKLAVDYKEVTVTRRLYRSGESEYLINGSGCRLKDINEMFYDTGIGKEGYSIIGQGQIDKILSGKPEERRELFDEAAGIVKFKRRKNTTLKKLEEEKQNLVRVTDILTELTRQLEPLRKQSETARLYLAKKEEVKELDMNLFLLEAEHIRKQLEELEEKSQNTQGDLETSREQFQEIKTEYEKLESQLDSLNAKMDEAREISQNEALKKQQLEGQKDVLQEQIHAAQQNQEHYQNRLETILEEIQRRKAEIKDYQKQKEELEETQKAVKSRLTREEMRVQKLEDAIGECAEAVEGGKSEIIELLNSRANTRGKAQRYDAMMEQIGIRRAELNQRTLTLKTEEEQQQSVFRKTKEEYDAITKRLKQMKEESIQMDEEVKRLQEEIRKQNEQMDVGQTAYHRESSRLESLKNITERYDGYGNSIRKVMEQKKHITGIKGVVADIIKVKKSYETAIETALGGSIQNIVTDNEQTAKQMIGFLKKNRYGRATFLPLSTVTSRGEFNQKDALKEPGVIGLAHELVQADQEYEGLVKYLLGRTLVVDQIDHAIAIGKKYRHTLRMVTIEGESLNPGGSMTGGAFKSTSNLLGRRREIEELESSVAALKKDMDEMQHAIEENRKQRNLLRDTIAQFHEKMQKQYILQNTAKLQMEQMKQKGTEIQEGYRQIQMEHDEILRQTKEIQNSHQAIREELEASSRDEKELEAFIETKQKELDQLREEEGQGQKELEKIRMESSQAVQKESFLKENLSRIRQEQEKYLQEQQEIEKNLKLWQQEIENRKQETEEILEDVRQASMTEEEAKARMEGYVKEKEAISRSHRSFFEKRDELSSHISRLDKECFRLNSQIEKLEDIQEGQISYLWEEYEITPGQAKEYRKEEYADRSLLKKKVSEKKDEIRKLGNVNVNAIEDYKDVSERHAFLSAQYEDLTRAEQTLMGIVQELDEGMRRQFAEKFKDIQREFDKAFKELFGGGKGTLELSQEEDILEAGIKIISQPPGKKLQNMMQLSGGEKALTAIALLFAIQNLKPSPFCLLDEIEAALDDSNVDRFAGYLKKLTKNTQFIIITHRRGTMNAADRLYGITMQEKGVSTLVSVDLVENALDK